MSRAGRWKSDSQANAEALARRSMPYSEASGRSFTVSWDWHNREPKDLREAVRMVRAAYADEVPTKLHNQDLADDGTPRMTPQAEGYIFGSDMAGEAKPIDEVTVDYYRTPFRAALAHLERQSPPRAAVLRDVAVTGMNPVEAGRHNGVPVWCAKVVAEDVLRSFLRNLTDIKVHLPREEAA